MLCVQEFDLIKKTQGRHTIGFWLQHLYYGFEKFHCGYTHAHHSTTATLSFVYPTRDITVQ